MNIKSTSQQLESFEHDMDQWKNSLAKVAAAMPEEERDIWWSEKMAEIDSMRQNIINAIEKRI